MLSVLVSDGTIHNARVTGPYHASSLEQVHSLACGIVSAQNAAAKEDALVPKPSQLPANGLLWRDDKAAQDAMKWAADSITRHYDDMNRPRYRVIIHQLRSHCRSLISPVWDCTQARMGENHPAGTS